MSWCASCSRPATASRPSTSARRAGSAISELGRRHSGRLELRRGDFAADKSLLSGKFDAYFHFAAIVGVQYVTDHPYETMAVEHADDAQRARRRARVRLPHVLLGFLERGSAASVDRNLAPIPTPEDVLLAIDDIALPRWSYAASKIAGESAVFGAAKLGGFTPIVVRFHNVYGPRMGPTHVIPEFLARARAKVNPFRSSAPTRPAPSCTSTTPPTPCAPCSAPP